jgi:type VII secretion protein EccB
VPTRQDQLQAYQFVQRRLTYAALTGQPDTADLPLRRTTLAIIGGVLIAAILLAGWATAGLLGAAAPDWRDEHALIIDRQTGARYLYRDGTLYPVLNYASARLVLGTAAVATRWVRGDVLNRAPHGPTIGIPGAPDGIPDAGNLVGLPWTVCGGPVDNTLKDWTVIGTPVPGGTVSTNGVLVQNARNNYLIWHNQRFAVPTDRPALVALHWDVVTPIQVPVTVLNQFPKGRDLAPSVADLGQPITLGGQALQIGQVLDVQQASGRHQYYLVLHDGVAPIGETTYLLLTAAKHVRPLDPDGNPQPPKVVPVDYVSAIPPSSTVLLTPDLPDQVPKLDNGSGRDYVCVRYTASNGDRPDLAAVLFDAPPPGSSGHLNRGGEGTVAVVTIPAGAGVLLRTIEDGQVSLVTDQGLRFPIADHAAQVALGLGSVQPLVVPSALAAVLPQGPQLDTDAARGPAVAAPTASATTRPG